MKVLRCCDYVIQRHPHEFEAGDLGRFFRWGTSKHENVETCVLANYFYLFSSNEDTKGETDLGLKRTLI